MICRLCKREKGKLSNSHIIPDFLFRLLKRSFDISKTTQNSFFQISNSKLPSKKQTGFFEKLLCDKCESYLSNFERYASQVLVYNKNHLIDDYQEKAVIHGIDYNKFKLFLLSILWKASISSLKQFNNVSLGKHEEIIREMILNNNAGEYYEYGCIVMMTVFNEQDLLDVIHNLIILPKRIKFKGLDAYRMLFGSLWWIQLVDKSASKLPSELFLSRNGFLPIYKETKYSANFIKQLLRKVKIKVIG